MLFKRLVVQFLTAVTSIIILPTTVHSTSNFDFPDVIARVDIPPGIIVYEYNATAAALGDAAAEEQAKLTPFPRQLSSDCSGSPYCRDTSSEA
ncbi:hypothetical protein MMC07_007942, partial [Pseudocyphellaria aurata]|nr:hypothetical protein [Pseudocyphellaria aurata]